MKSASGICRLVGFDSGRALLVVEFHNRGVTGVQRRIGRRADDHQAGHFLPCARIWELIAMDPRRLSDRTRRALALLSPEKRGRAEAALVRIQSPEYQGRERRDREGLDREYRATGGISGARVTGVDAKAFQAFVGSLRRARKSAGLTLDEVASRSGMDKAQLSRLENGWVADPRPSTLARYALAIGKRLTWSLEDIESSRP
jgi:hypothetical protein